MELGEVFSPQNVNGSVLKDRERRLLITSPQASEGCTHGTYTDTVTIAAVERYASDFTRAHRCNPGVPSLTYSAMRMLRPRHTGNHTYPRYLRVRYNKYNVVLCHTLSIFMYVYPGTSMRPKTVGPIPGKPHRGTPSRNCRALHRVSVQMRQVGLRRCDGHKLQVGVSF